MHLSIYSIRETIFEGETASVSVPTPLGEMTVLDHHIPMVSLVSRGEIRIAAVHREQDREADHASTTLPFRGGILEVRPESEVIILANP